MVGVISLVTGMAGPSGFGSASTAEQVTEGVDASNLTAIITGQFSFAISVSLFQHVQISFIYTRIMVLFILFLTPHVINLISYVHRKQFLYFINLISYTLF